MNFTPIDLSHFEFPGNSVEITIKNILHEVTFKGAIIQMYTSQHALTYTPLSIWINVFDDQGTIEGMDEW